MASGRPAWTAAGVALLAAATLVGVALGVDRALRANHREHVDGRLARTLHAASAALAAETRAVGARTRRLGRSPPLVRALASGNRAALARVAGGSGIAIYVRGRLVAGSDPSRAVRRVVEVRRRGVAVGAVVASLPLDETLLRRLVPVDEPDAVLAFVADGHVFAATAPLGGRPLSVSPDATEVTAGGERYRARAVTAIAGAHATQLAALLAAPELAVSTSWTVIASLVTAATVAVLIGALVTVRAQSRGRLRERRRRLGPRGQGKGAREALALVGDALAATHDPQALLPVVLGATIEATGALGGRLVEGDRELASAGQTWGYGEPLALQLGDEAESRLLLYPPRGGFSDEARELAGWLASQASIALENAHLHGLVQLQAITDELTGLANRRRFIEALGLELKRAERFGSPLALVLADLDNFKLINDQFGHATGDRVLTALAGVLRHSLREVDVPARIGGEEFAVLLPETDPAGAHDLAERLRAEVSSVELLGPDGEPLVVTASFGVATHPPAESGDALLSIADAALYRAKRQGKNRVVVGDEAEAASEPPARPI
jgi:diguanylate cyclase (GGDEF)-like protein